MPKRIAHIILSFWIALLLLFGSTAKEFIHLFANHDDSAELYHPAGELSFENEHHHCDFLSFSLTPFVHLESSSAVFFEGYPFCIYYGSLTSVFFTTVRSIPSLRGPPSHC